ncbi:hypothetical protein O7627_31465 [Solwaraspora sp. WMMD1047]|uniref:hypothetical protein n=1 Tax=Solwaraspora sp. WMMD1047 TaxID=3016102 RepID=UPI00241687C5|nr:hypothetical protein [Solwaraspora sp. WMMD1047]MDG4833798.1 hypothetical protein [Solwaraspora sp. WMMD1047]
MTDHRDRVERSSDEDFETLRRVRFGRLPTRVLPAELVETAETDPPHEEADPMVRREWG